MAPLCSCGRIEGEGLCLRQEIENLVGLQALQHPRRILPSFRHGGGIQLGLVGLIPNSRIPRCGVEAMLVGPGEVVVISGGRMEKIWSSVVGGP